MVLGWSVSHGLACLLLDGPLAMKVPDAAKAKEAVVRETLGLMQRMLEAMAVRSTPPSGKRLPAKAAKRSKASRA